MNGGAGDVQEYPGASAPRVGATLAGIVLAAVVVFGLGVMVGKRVAESVPVAAAPPTALPTETLPIQPAAPATPIAPEKLTFYDRLSGVGPAAPQPEPPPVAHAPQQPLATALPATGATSAPAAPASPAPAPGTAPPASATPSARQPAAKAAPPTAAPTPAAQIKKLAGKGHFAVQVGAVSERADAEAMAGRIKSQGFDAVIVMASIKGKVWYRIRAGSFPTRQSATLAASLFHSAYGFNAAAVEN